MSQGPLGRTFSESHRFSRHTFFCVFCVIRSPGYASCLTGLVIRDKIFKTVYGLKTRFLKLMLSSSFVNIMPCLKCMRNPQLMGHDIW